MSKENGTQGFGFSPKRNVLLDRNLRDIITECFDGSLTL